MATALSARMRIQGGESAGEVAWTGLWWIGGWVKGCGGGLGKVGVGY